MAVEIGTAANPTDLYTKLVSFLKTNADLVAAGQAWTEVWSAPVGAANLTDKVLRGPGLSGQDQVYIGMRLTQRPATDAYFIEFSGNTGVIPEAANFRDHVNDQPFPVRMFTDVGTVSYWFIANGRRFMVVLKISTVFESCYCGLFLPYADPLSYPYPLFVGASAGPADQNGSAVNWRSELDSHRHFLWGNYVQINYSFYNEATGWTLNPQGSWQRTGNYGTAMPVVIGPQRTNGDYIFDQNSVYGIMAEPIMTRLVEAYGGERMLWPCTLIQIDPTDETYGIFDGAYRCQGVANASENRITVDGVDHLVVQNAFRTDFNNFWAAALE